MILTEIAGSLTGRQRYKYFRQFKKIQWLDEHQLHQIQFIRLKKLLQHAYETIPFYTDVFKELQIKY